MRKIIILFLLPYFLYSLETIKIYDRFNEERLIVIPYDKYNLDIKEIYNYVYNNGKIRQGFYPEGFDAVKYQTFENKNFKIDIDCFFSVAKLKRQLKIFLKQKKDNKTFTLIDNGLNGLFEEDIFLINHISQSYYSAEIKSFLKVVLNEIKKK